jgi:hypothetical protein
LGLSARRGVKRWKRGFLTPTPLSLQGEGQSRD